MEVRRFDLSTGKEIVEDVGQFLKKVGELDENLEAEDKVTGSTFGYSGSEVTAGRGRGWGWEQLKRLLADSPPIGAEEVKQLEDKTNE